MIREIKKGNTVVVRGATRVKLLEGELEILGKEVLPKKEEDSQDQSELSEGVVIVPSALSFPLYAIKNSKLEIFTSNDNNIELVSEHSIPIEWRKIKDDLVEQIKNHEGNVPLKIMVLGISSGKTTLIKYLANNFIKENILGGYLDSDLGQQILLPTTLMIGLIDKPFLSLKQIEEDKRHFVGATFPKGNLKFIVSHY
ncbi:MAG: Clp1/GlmU family protein, partial [Promethearchaeota archaeon]